MGRDHYLTSSSRTLLSNVAEEVKVESIDTIQALKYKTLQRQCESIYLEGEIPNEGENGKSFITYPVLAAPVCFHCKHWGNYGDIAIFNLWMAMLSLHTCSHKIKKKRKSDFVNLPSLCQFNFIVSSSTDVVA